MRRILNIAKMAAKFIFFYLPMNLLTVGMVWGTLRLITLVIPALAQPLNTFIWVNTVVLALLFSAGACYQDCTKKAENK